MQTIPSKLQSIVPLGIAVACLGQYGTAQTPQLGVSRSQSLTVRTAHQAPTIFLSPLTSSTAPLRTNWKTLGGGPEHSGYYPDTVASATFAPGWVTVLSEYIQHVAIADGRAFATPLQYFGSAWLTSLDTSDGHAVWTHVFDSCYSINPPTVDGVHVYVQRCNQASDSQLWSFSAESGVPEWSAPYSTQGDNYMAPTVAEGKVWINGGYFGGMYGFEQASGTQLFFNAAPTSDTWTPTYFAGKVYSWTDWTLREHDPVSGNVLWSADLGFEQGTVSPRRNAAVVNGRAYVIGNSNLHCVDLSSHLPVWAVDGHFLGTPAIANGIVYAIGNGAVETYDAWNGTHLATYPGEPVLLDQPIVTDDAVMFASTAHTFVYRLGTSTPASIINFGGNLSIADGRLYIATSNGRIRTFSAEGSDPALPNLVAEWQVWSRSNGLAGTPRTSRLIITNFGSAPSGPAHASLFLSSDTVLDAADTQLRSVQFPSVAVGERLMTTVVLPEDPVFTGQYLLVVPDSEGAILESNENNVAPSGRIP